MIISLTNKKAESRSNRKLSGYPIKKCLLRRKFEITKEGIESKSVKRSAVEPIGTRRDLSPSQFLERVGKFVPKVKFF